MTYEVDGYTFTVQQLQGENPYANPDGTVREGFSFAFFAFVEAKVRYELDQMTPEERDRAIEHHRRFKAKMNSGGL